MISLHVSNDRCEIHGAPEPLLKALDRVTSFVEDEERNRLHQWECKADPENAWDGRHRFLHRPKRLPPWVPAGLRWLVRDTCMLHGHAVEIIDHRRPEEPGVPEIAPIPLRGYQEAAVQALQHLGPPRYERRLDGVLVAPPRAGKTRTMAEHVRKNWLPTLWLCPTNEITDQTVRALSEFFGDRVMRVKSSNTDAAADVLVTVATVQGAASLPPSFWQTRRLLVMDEVHHVLSNNKWGKTIAQLGKHITLRFGMSGTFFRSNGDDLAMHAFLADVAFKIDTQQLVDWGYLTPTFFGFIPVPGKIRGADQSKFMGHNGFGTKGIHHYEPRQELAARATLELAVRGYRTLVLVGTKKQGYDLQKRIAAQFPSAPLGCEFETVETISTDRITTHQQGILESFRNGQEVRILIGTSIIGEGVDLPTADAMVFAAGGKASVQLTQAWFRVCTALPGKQASIILDFWDGQLAKLRKHSEQRHAIASQEPTFNVTVFQNAWDFIPWLGV